MLGYAAACDVFGASLYEPCGQIDQVGNIFGATATNRDTGGYHDKIRELRLEKTVRLRMWETVSCSVIMTPAVSGTHWRRVWLFTICRRRSGSDR